MTALDVAVQTTMLVVQLAAWAATVDAILVAGRGAVLPAAMTAAAVALAPIVPSALFGWFGWAAAASLIAALVLLWLLAGGQRPGRAIRRAGIALSLSLLSVLTFFAGAIILLRDFDIPMQDVPPFPHAD